MVDSIGSTPIASGSVTRVAAPAAAPMVQPALDRTASQAPPAQAPAAQLSGLAKSMAASAPVDSDRVDAIKKAIATGTFPILPATIADRLLALKLNWNGHDAA